ncbi:MAG: fumarylacetoacetate hydrolase family protein [Phycisphaerales bacterium]
MSSGRFAGVDRPPMILAIGRNYAAHAAEMGGDRPAHPMVFAKNPAALIADGQAIVIPPICREGETASDDGRQVDFEGELAVIIGRDVRDVAEADALDAVFGYAAANDVSARWWQKHGSGGQFVRGKSFDTFCPIGEIVPADVAGDPSDWTLTTDVGGERMQTGTTADLIFPVAWLIAELSRGMTLLRGTAILTGTPSGVGHARTPPRYLRDGDRVRVEIQNTSGMMASVENPVVEAN